MPEFAEKRRMRSFDRFSGQTGLRGGVWARIHTVVLRFHALSLQAKILAFMGGALLACLGVVKATSPAFEYGVSVPFEADALFFC